MAEIIFPMVASNAAALSISSIALVLAIIAISRT